jgi:hypothetical protein
MPYDHQPMIIPLVKTIQNNKKIEQQCGILCSESVGNHLTVCMKQQRVLKVAGNCMC